MSDLPGVVASGDRVASLRAIRDNLAANIEAAAPQYVAGLSKQLAEVMRELESIAPPNQKSALDEIAGQRDKRRARTSVPKRRSSRNHGGEGSG